MSNAEESPSNNNASNEPVQSLHILTLHDDPNANDYERFQFQWILDESGAESIISEGDLIHIPDLITGAGEFEGIRFVGKRLETNKKQFELLPGGIEYPEFPGYIMDKHTSKNLKSVYAGLLLKMLTLDGNDSLVDLIVGDDAEEAWANPARLREKEYSGTWIIPLKDCTIQQTIRE